MDKWDLTRIYPSEDAFEKDLERIRSLIGELKELEGKLNTEEGFRSYLDISREVELVLSRLYMFAAHRSDLNKKDVKNAEAETRVELLAHELSAAASFAEPEILEAGKDFVDSFLKEHPEYQEFDFYFHKLFRGQKYVLDKKSEALLSNFTSLMGEGSNLYSLLTVADYSPSEVTLSGNRKVTVSGSNWSNLIAEEKDPEDRKKIFESLYKYYDGRKNAYGEMYSAVMNARLANKKSRGYDSILAAKLYDDDIPESVYTTLIEAAHEGSKYLKKYYEIRRKYLGLEKHRSYDRFLQLAHSEKKYEYEDAKKMFFESAKNMPEDFQEKAHEVLKEGYVDVYHQDGKRGGAYSSGGATIHPYILLNYERDLDDCFTVAHEAGHSIHTLYSMENQPLMKSSYTIFVAEIASTFNEHNLLDYLLESGNLTKEEEIRLLQKEIDEICGTFFRQTLFAEYELKVSKLVEAGQPINHAVLSNIMVELYREYYGIDISEEVYKPLVWAYIPHLFYTPFYVYQYATSFTASMLLYKQVKSGKEGAVDRYLGLLKSGGSDFPVNQVKAAGVDLTKKESYEAVTSRMGELVDRLEKALFQK